MFSEKQLEKISLNREEFEEYLNEYMDTKVNFNGIGIRNAVITYYDKDIDMELKYILLTGDIVQARTGAVITTAEKSRDNYYIDLITRLVEDYKDKVERNFGTTFEQYYIFKSTHFIYKSNTNCNILIRNKDIVYVFSNDNLEIKPLTEKNVENKIKKNMENVIGVYNVYLDQQAGEDVIRFNDRFFISNNLLENIVSEKSIWIRDFVDCYLEPDLYYNKKNVFMYSFGIVFVLFFILYMFCLTAMLMFKYELLGNADELSSAMTTLTKIVGTLAGVSFLGLSGLGLYLNSKEFYGIEDIDSLRSSLDRENLEGYVEITNEPRLLAYILEDHYFNESGRRHDTTPTNSKPTKKEGLSNYNIDLFEAIENFDKLDQSTQKIVEDNIDLIMKNSNDGDISGLNESININMTVLNDILREKGEGKNVF